MQLLALLLAGVGSSGCCWVIIWLCVWSRFSATAQHNQQKPTTLTFVTPICSFLNFSRGLMSRSDAFWTYRGKQSSTIRDGTVTKQQTQFSGYVSKASKRRAYEVAYKKGTLKWNYGEVFLWCRQSRMCVSTERVNCWSCNNCVCSSVSE